MLTKTTEYNIYSFIYLIVKHPLCLECYTRHGGFSGYNNRRDPSWVSGHEICTLDPVLSNSLPSPASLDWITPVGLQTFNISILKNTKN